MQYLTYDEYKEMGGMLDMTAFARNIDRACIELDSQTFGRIRAMREIPRSVKACCRDLVEYFFNHNAIEKNASSISHSAGGVSESISFVVGMTEKEIENIVFGYLANTSDDFFTPLLYRGAKI